MTEILQNNNGIKFDLLEPGNSGASISGSEGLFNSLLGIVDTHSEDDLQEYKALENEDTIADGNIFQILDLLQKSDLNLTIDTLKDIKKNLKDFFRNLELNVEAQQNVHPKQASSFGNENFLHLMKFLEELKSLIINQAQNKNINQEIDLVLDKLRVKLNEQIKATLTTNNLQKDSEKNVIKIKNHDQIDTIGRGNQSSYGKGISSTIDKNPNELKDFQTKKIDFGNLKNNGLKADNEKKFSTKHTSLNISQHQENRIPQIQGTGDGSVEKSMDISNQNLINRVQLKELNFEPSSMRQPATLTNKLDTAPNLESANVQKPLTSAQENNDKLLHTLNMLSKTWGNKLIEKIEKSIVDGIEKLEISLTPKSLGRLNVTINIHDTVAKINIIAESASAAALLSEAEHKLSQMMEASGLKLASLQTQNQQYGNKQKEKGQDQKLASTIKKSSIDDNSKSSEAIGKTDSESEGLNLIA